VSRIGFIGLGIMGKPMALNLRKAGLQLTVYNRSASKVRDLIDVGAAAAADPAAVARESDVIITMLTDTPDVEAVLFGKRGVAEAVRPGSTVIDMSTISPAAAVDFGKRLVAIGCDFLDAPVSGGDSGAKQGTLAIMVGGDERVFARVRHLFEAMGKRIARVGPIGAGQAVKACNQILAAVNLIGTCEALTMATAFGVDPKAMVEVVSGGAAGSWSLANLGPKIIAGDLAPAFKISLMQKDLEIVARAAADAQVPLPGATLAMQLFRSVQAHAGSDLGTQAMIRAYEQLANRAVSQRPA
jgi:3-hydroxyisobutyrate dehydrogenase